MTGGRTCRGAFSSEVDTCSREEEVLTQHMRAFHSFHETL